MTGKVHGAAGRQAMAAALCLSAASGPAPADPGGTAPGGTAGPASTVAGAVRWLGPVPAAGAVFELPRDATPCAIDGRLADPRADDIDRRTLLTAGAAVWLEAVDAADLPTTAPSGFRLRPVLTAEGCRLVPAITVLPAGERLRFLSLDPIPHHLTVDPPAGFEATVDLLTRGASRDVRFANPGLHHVRDPRHGWMGAAVLVAPNLHATVTGADGVFRFDAVPPGRFRLRAWHVGLWSAPRRVAGLTRGYVPAADETAAVDLELPRDATRPLQLSLGSSDDPVSTQADDRPMADRDPTPTPVPPPVAGAAARTAPRFRAAHTAAAAAEAFARSFPGKTVDDLSRRAARVAVESSPDADAVPIRK